ncbi:MAG: hypothetical protein WC121_14430 [Candidatus Kapaibacterium sp.]
MKYFIIIILLFTLQSCRSDKCNSVNEINVGELLLITSNEKSYNYCELLENALEKDQKAILNLSLLEFNGSVSYDHGYVLIMLIDRIGEVEYLKAIKYISNNDRSFIEEYLDAGFEYGDISKYQGQSLKKVFPEIYRFLNQF